MEWIAFNEDCPKDKEMLFLYYGTDAWFSGEYTDDSEYGLCIETSDYHFVEPKFISHYLIIEIPTQKIKLK